MNLKKSFPLNRIKRSLETVGLVYKILKYIKKNSIALEGLEINLSHKLGKRERERQLSAGASETRAVCGCFSLSKLQC